MAAPNPLSNNKTDPDIDKGWAWVVMVVSFLFNVLIDGIAWSFGLLLINLVDYFDSNRAEVALVSSVQTGVYMITGPITSILINKLGYQVVGVASCVLGAIAFIAATFTPPHALVMLIITYGVIGGLSFSGLYLTAYIATGLSFTTKRPLAVGIAACGSGVGMFVIPAIIEKILQATSWQFCVGVQAGCLLLGAVLSQAYNPPGYIQKKKTLDGKSTKPDGVCQQLKGLLNWHLLKDPIFLVLMVAAVFTTIGNVIPIIYITDLAEERGFNNTGTLLTIMGATNTVGRVLAGGAVYIKLVNPMVAVGVMCLLGGTMNLFVSFYYQYSALAFFSAIHGLTFATDASINTEILARVLGAENLSGAFGLICLSRGIALFIATPVGGALKDNTSMYDHTFYVAGASYLTNSLLLSVCFILVRRRQRAYNDKSTIMTSNNTPMDSINDTQMQNRREATI